MRNCATTSSDIGNWSYLQVRDFFLLLFQLLLDGVLGSFLRLALLLLLCLVLGGIATEVGLAHKRTEALREL